jgi:hypothetical protein
MKETINQSNERKPVNAINAKTDKVTTSQQTHPHPHTAITR